MILAFTKAIDDLYFPDLFNLNQQSSGQRTPLSVYAFAFGKVCVILASDLFATILVDNARNFSLPPSTIPVGYSCDRCIRPVFHTCQSPTLLCCFGQAMHILGNKIILTFPLWTSVFPSPCSDLGVWHSPEAFDCANCTGMTGLIGCWGDALSLSKFLASHDLSGSLFMGSGSNAAEPRFPK